MNRVTLLIVTNILSLFLVAYLSYNLVQSKSSPRAAPNSPESQPQSLESQSQYQPGSREECLDNIRVEVNKEFVGIIKDACGSQYLDPLCESRMRGLIQNQFTKDVENCIKVTKP